MDLSIVIVSWNTRKLLEACLRSVYAETRGLTFEVFVVDNASVDGSPEMVERAFPQVRLIRNAANVGFARASNQALRLSRGRYVLLLNPDTVILDQALVRMVHFMDQHPDIGALGPKILTAEGEVDLRCARRFPSLLSELLELTRLSARFPHNRLFGNYLMSYWDHNDSREVEVLMGACLLVRREAMEQVGLLDENFYMYGEDVDWCYRLRKAGWRVWYDSQDYIIHLGSQSTKLVQEEMGLERFKSRHALFRKHRGSLYAGAYKALMLAITLAKQAAFWAKALMSRDKGQRHRYQDKVRLHGQVLRWIFSP
mgnify:CR=1 FL=1